MDRYESLIKLQLDVDAILEEASKLKSLFREDPINWGDLSCVSTEYYETCFGENGSRVFISEAAPEATTLKEFVFDKLRERDWIGIEVITEW